MLEKFIPHKGNALYWNAIHIPLAEKFNQRNTQTNLQKTGENIPEKVCRTVLGRLCWARASTTASSTLEQGEVDINRIKKKLIQYIAHYFKSTRGKRYHYKQFLKFMSTDEKCKQNICT
jgi:hypothetical protein